MKKFILLPLAVFSLMLASCQKHDESEDAIKGQIESGLKEVYEKNGTKYEPLSYSDFIPSSFDNTDKATVVVLKAANNMSDADYKQFIDKLAWMEIVTIGRLIEDWDEYYATLKYIGKVIEKAGVAPTRYSVMHEYRLTEGDISFKMKYVFETDCGKKNITATHAVDFSKELWDAHQRVSK